jgi:hypothetical protein
VGGGDTVDDSQTEPRTVPGRRVAGFEDAVLLTGWNASPVVGNEEAVARWTDTDRDSVAVRAAGVGLRWIARGFVPPAVI